MDLFLEIFNYFLAVFPLSGSQADQKLLFGIVLAWLFKKFQHFEGRSCELSIVEEGQVGSKMIAEVERMLDFVPDVG